MLEFPGEGVNLRKSAVFCENLRFGPSARDLKAPVAGQAFLNLSSTDPTKKDLSAHSHDQLYREEGRIEGLGHVDAQIFILSRAG